MSVLERYEPCLGALPSALEPPPQLEILFCDSPLPGPNSSFTNLLPACTETRLSEIPSAKPSCTLLPMDKSFPIAGSAGEEFGLMLY